MGSKVVVTYKRKRLFSRSDHSLINIHSDTSCESAKSKPSDNFPNDTGFGSLAHSKDDVGENVLRCEDCGSHCCSQCSENHARKPDMLYKDSSVSVKAQKYTPEKKYFPNADEKQIRSHPNLNESPEVRFSIDSSGRSNAVQSGSEDEDNCKKILTVSQLPDACTGAEPDPIYLKISAGINCSYQMDGTCTPEASILEETDKFNTDMKGTCTPEASILKETDKFNTDQYSSLCNNSGMKRKLTSALITFCRRSKRNGADIAAKSATPPAATCLVDLKNEKELPEDNGNSCSFSAPAPVTSTFVPHGEAADSPNAAARYCQDSQEQMLQHKVCIGVLYNHHINLTTQRLSNEDVKSRITHSDVSGRGGSVMSLDLTVPPHASHNIVCNLPFDGGSDENQPVEMSELLHDSLGSTCKTKEEMLSLPVQQHVENGSPVRADSGKGKCILEFPPVLTCNSSKNKYIQFFPESRSDAMLQLGNNSEKVSPLHRSSLQSSNLIDLSLQPEQMVDGCASFPPSCEWPNVQVQSRESFHSLQLSQSSARDKMMLENILTRARAVRGNKSSFLDKFEYPTTWLDEELDSLWIGVRRHGRGNWDAILGDRRLHFLPWKMPWDLAERWQVEQSCLLSSMPVSQRRYASPPDFSSEHGNILHHPRPEAQADEVLLSLGITPHFMSNKKRDVQRPVTNSGVGDESSSSTGGISLPHWLRTSAQFPPGPGRPVHVVPSGCHSGPAWLNQPSFNYGATPQQPWLSNRYIPAQRRPEPQNVGKTPLVIGGGKTQPDEHPAGKQEDLIIIPSDASSEETISDDHSIRP